MLKYSFQALGTSWTIETEQEIEQTLKDDIQQRIIAFDLTYSRFNTNSLVTKISKEAGVYRFPDDSIHLINFYKQLYGLTNGKVTPLIGDMISRAGYDANYSLQPKTPKPIVLWDDAMSWDEGLLTTHQPVILDFGAAGKGYLVDIIAQMLEDNAITDYVIDASGDLRHKGASENKVGLEHPLDLTKVIGVVDIKDRSLCASASNRRAWGQGMHHVFDPDIMAPTNDVIATWVVADETMIADGLATALFLVEPKIISPKYDFEYVRVFADGKVEYSKYFEGKLF